ncbi:MAG: discoidin domain-containing protein [Deltaproteobacteria bacterium]
MAEAATSSRKSKSGGGAVLEWFTRRDALAAARRDPRALDARQRGLFERARGALIVAERIAPSEGATVPLEDAGDDVARALLALSVLRDATAWALAVDLAAAPGTLAEAFDASDGEALSKAAGGAEGLARARRVLMDEESLARAARPVADLRADVEVARALTRALVSGLELRATSLARVRTERWVRSLGTLAVILIALFGTNSFLAGRRPDLVPRARWTASSADLGWGSSGIGLAGPRGPADVFFHTREQTNPWVEFDLGHSVPISRVVIANRADCCQERVAPLAIETSEDRRTWREVARRDDSFVTWDKTFLFRPHGRYVRIRSMHVTVLHLARVEIH